MILLLGMTLVMRLLKVILQGRQNLFRISLMNEMRKQDNAAPTGLAAFYEVTDDQYSMYYTHRDHLGSIKCITNESGVVIEKMNFDPWGNWRNPTDWSETSVPSPVKLARFLSPDILVQDKTYTQSFNRYTYTLNNPLKYTDPSGYKLLIPVIPCHLFR